MFTLHRPPLFSAFVECGVWYCLRELWPVLILSSWREPFQRFNFFNYDLPFRSISIVGESARFSMCTENSSGSSDSRDLVLYQLSSSVNCLQWQDLLTLSTTMEVHSFKRCKQVSSAFRHLLCFEQERKLVGNTSIFLKKLYIRNHLFKSKRKAHYYKMHCLVFVEYVAYFWKFFLAIRRISTTTSLVYSSRYL